MWRHQKEIRGRGHGHFCIPGPQGPIPGASELVTTLPEAVAIVQAAIIARYGIPLLSLNFVILRLKLFRFRLRLRVVYSLDSKLCMTGHVLHTLKVPSRSFWSCLRTFRVKKECSFARCSEFVV